MPIFRKSPEEQPAKPSAEIVSLDAWRKARGLPPARPRIIVYLDDENAHR